jgi:hypothetical protein
MTTHFKNIIQNMLSIRGTYLIPGCSYVERMSSLAEQPRSRIEYDFQKTRVTGPWDHKVSVSAKKVIKKNFMLVYLEPMVTILCNGFILLWLYIFIVI